MGFAAIVIIVLIIASYFISFKVYRIFEEKEKNIRIALSVGAFLLSFAILFSISAYVVISNVSFSR